MTEQHRIQQRWLNAVVEALSQQLGSDLVAVVLFGSHARGDATEWSDWDLLVLARHLPDDVLPRHQGMKQLLPETHRARVSVLAKTPEEFEAALPPYGWTSRWMGSCCTTRQAMLPTGWKRSSR